MVTTLRIVTTFAGMTTLGSSGDGGPATSAQLNFPVGVSLDNIGNVFIVDLFNFKIRYEKIDQNTYNNQSTSLKISLIQSHTRMPHLVSYHTPFPHIYPHPFYSIFPP